MPRISAATLTAILGLALVLAVSWHFSGGPTSGVALDGHGLASGHAAPELTQETPPFVSSSKRMAAPDRQERLTFPRCPEAPGSTVEPAPLRIHVTGCGPELESVTAHIRTAMASGARDDGPSCRLERLGELASGLLPCPRTRGARIELELVDRGATPTQVILEFDLDVDLDTERPASVPSIWHLDLSTVRYEFTTDRSKSFFVGDSAFEPYTCSRGQSSQTNTAPRYLPPLQRYVVYSTDVPLRESFRDFEGRIVHRGPWTPGFHVLRF
ncbi:MAG: hypothetical protein KDC95_02330 [Planctomycetes bacterium]|nr:hypothetical protein [Planctomycetota bacterium]